MAGEIGNYIVPNSAGIFRFDQAYGLNNELTEDVSDHYPIECELQGRRELKGINVGSQNKVHIPEVPA